MNSRKVKAVNCHFTLRWSTTKNSNEGKMTPEIADGVCVELIQYMDCWRDEWMGSLLRCLMIHWLFVDSQNLWARQPTTVAVPMLSVSLFVKLSLMAHHHYNIILWTADKWWYLCHQYPCLWHSLWWHIIIIILSYEQLTSGGTYVISMLVCDTHFDGTSSLYL